MDGLGQSAMTYEGTCDGIRVRLEGTEHGPALSVEFWEDGLDEPRAGSTVYLSPDMVAGMAKWLSAFQLQ
jgi:hypothetical protein